MLDKEVINLAIKGKYTEFSNSVISELKTKLNDHEDVKAYTSKYDDMENMKTAFNKINSQGSSEK